MTIFINPEHEGGVMSILLTESAWGRKEPSLGVKRRALRYPPPALEGTSVRYLDSALDILRGLPALPVMEGKERAFARWVSPDQVRSLREATMDPLSAKLAGPFSEMSNFEERGSSEAVVADILRRGNLDVGTLEELAGLGVGCPRLPVRIGPAYSTRDADGQRTEFIDPEEVPMSLRSICAVMNEESSECHVMLSALWILVSTLHTHAFEDGNGRLARALMNAFLMKAGILVNGPIPLGPLIYATKGNFRIAVNRATILKNWIPLSKVFFLMISSFARLQPEWLQKERADFA